MHPNAMALTSPHFTNYRPVQAVASAIVAHLPEIINAILAGVPAIEFAILAAFPATQPLRLMSVSIAVLSTSWQLFHQPQMDVGAG